MPWYESSNTLLNTEDAAVSIVVSASSPLFAARVFHHMSKCRRGNPSADTLSDRWTAI
jgi:hypothetical protein